MSGKADFTASCVLGPGGLHWLKSEGDGRTPIGFFKALKVYYRPDRGARPVTGLPITRITPDLGWCDEPKDRNYNKQIELPYPASHEELWRKDHLYDLMVVLDINIHPRKRGRGSAIFFHLKHLDDKPSAGCITVTPNVMQRFLAVADNETYFWIRR